MRPVFVIGETVPGRVISGNIAGIQVGTLTNPNAEGKRHGQRKQQEIRGRAAGSGQGRRHRRHDPDTAENLPENEVLSNRDTSRHSSQRGLDSRHVQNQQYHDHAGNREQADEGDLPDEPRR